jgi:hypothetical protein
LDPGSLAGGEFERKWALKKLGLLGAENLNQILAFVPRNFDRKRAMDVKNFKFESLILILAVIFFTLRVIAS